MKVFKHDFQPLISDKYKYTISDESLDEVKVPDYNEYIGTIYLFVNNVNGKVYIGQTLTKFYSRFGAHYRDTFGKQDNLVFHKALRKYGWDNFSKYILWQAEDTVEATSENFKLLKSILDKKEADYIKKYNSNNSDYGYNMTLGGTDIPESAHSKDSIEKAIKTREDNKSNYMLGRTYGKHHLAVPILQYSTNKEFIKEWECIKLAEDTLHIRIYPKAITSGEYFWIYKNSNVDLVLEEKYSKYLLTKNCGRSKTIYCFDYFGELIGIYNSCAQASKITKISATTIAYSASSKNQSAGDYIWIYEEDLENKENIIENIRSRSRNYISKYRPIYQITLDGSIVKLWNNFESIKEEFPSGRSSINKCLNNKQNAYSNYFWVYEDEYSDDLLISKLNKYKKTKKTIVEETLAGEEKYNTVLHDTSNSKAFLKNNPVVYQFDKGGNFIKKWDNYKDIQIETGLKFDNISKCLRFKMKSAYNYIWRFEKDVDTEKNIIIM